MKEKRIISFPPNGYVMNAEDKATLIAAIENDEVQIVCLEVLPDDRQMLIRLDNVWAHMDFKDKSILK